MEDLFKEPMEMIVSQSKDFINPYTRVVIGNYEDGTFIGLHNIKTLEEYKIIKKTHEHVNFSRFRWQYAMVPFETYDIF